MQSPEKTPKRKARRDGLGIVLWNCYGVETGVNLLGQKDERRRQIFYGFLVKAATNVGLTVTKVLSRLYT